MEEEKDIRQPDPVADKMNIDAISNLITPQVTGMDLLAKESSRHSRVMELIIALKSNIFSEPDTPELKRKLKDLLMEERNV